ALGGAQGPPAPALVGDLPSAVAACVEGACAVRRGAGRVRGRRAHHGQPGRSGAGRAAHGHAHGGRLRTVPRRRPRAAVAAGRLSRSFLLLAAGLGMVLRGRVYVTGPSFWAEEGTLFFATAWGHSLRESLAYRPVGYLLLWANLATTAAARLARAGVLPLTPAPQGTLLCALLGPLPPPAPIACGRAPFGGGSVRRAIGVLVVLVGVLTDEVWLNTVNSQPWLVLAAVLLLLEPPASRRRRAWADTGVLALAGLTAPTTSALLP